MWIPGPSYPLDNTAFWANTACVNVLALGQKCWNSPPADIRPDPFSISETSRAEINDRSRVQCIVFCSLRIGVLHACRSLEAGQEDYFHFLYCFERS